MIIVELYLSLAVGWLLLEIIYIVIWLRSFYKEIDDRGRVVTPSAKTFLMGMVVPVLKSLGWPYIICRSGCLSVTVLGVQQDARETAVKIVAED